jgi:hypothetical protein
MPNAPAARRAEKTSHTGSNSRHRFTGTPSIPAHNGFNSYFVLSPAIGLFCRRRLTDMAGPRPVGPTSPPQDLTPASRCQDHTTSPSTAPVYAKGFAGVRCSSSARPLTVHGSFANPPCHHVARKHCRVHRIPFRVIDVAQRPSVGRDGGDIQLIWAF